MKNDYSVADDIAYIILTQGKICIIDTKDLQQISGYKWHAKKDGKTWYVTNTVRTSTHTWRTVLMHRLILGIHQDDCLQIDHINHNGLDNRRDNLRIVTNIRNLHNLSGKRQWRCGKKNTSDYPGVCWDRIRGQWKSAIRYNKQPIHLGYFQHEKQAAVIYQLAKDVIDAGGSVEDIKKLRKQRRKK